MGSPPMAPMANDPARDRKGGEAGSGEDAGSDAALAAIDFSTFLLSLSTAALYQMGHVPDPVTGQKTTPDRIMAHQTIDTLVMLRKKTQGNLEEEEDQLFESLLYELRMQFLKLGQQEDD